MENFLFEHNRIAYENVLNMFETEDRVAVVHPTGTGKSFIGFQLCLDKKDSKICWLSPSEYIFNTQIENFSKVCKQPLDDVSFFTYAKLGIMSEQEIGEITPDYIVLDEFHRCGAEMWGEGVQRLLNKYSQAKVLGLSATAIRYLDNQRNMAEELFDNNIASEMSLGEAIVKGILNPPKYVLSVFSYKKDLARYKQRVKVARNKIVQDNAEKYLEALRRALEKADGLDVVFDKHMTDRTGKYIVFCADFEHMHEMIERVDDWFYKIDKEPHIYTAYSNDPVTSKAFLKFKEDESEHLKLLFCIDMLNEGVHVDDVSGVILFRPTVSPIIYKQQIGRALSASKSKSPIIFDIVNNIENLYSIGSIEEEMRIAVNYYRTNGLTEEIVNEHFHIIDEVRDCKVLFERLKETLTGSWDLMFTKAKQYYEAFGDLNIPKRYKTEEGYSLGMWIQTQRKVRNGEQYGKLDDKQIAKLDSIGMVWDKFRDITFNKYYLAAKRYYAEHGNLVVPADKKTYYGVQLGGWLSRLRSYRKSNIKSTYLTEQHIRELDEIGMIWDIPDYLWERNYHAALEYYQKHGNLMVPAYYVTEDGIRLGDWIFNLRNARKNADIGRVLTDERIRKLDEIHFVWEGKQNLTWQRAYLAAVEYKKKNGNLDIPVNYVTQDGCRLGRWIRRQKEMLETVPDNKKKQLLDLGLKVDLIAPWDKKFELVKTYYLEFGNLNIPNNYVVEGVWIARWLSEQVARLNGKSRSGKTLTSDQIEKLISIGIQANVSKNDIAWNEQYEEARDFFEKNGNLDIPNNYIAKNGKNLYLWVRRQRTAYKEKKLSIEQIEKLEKIQMSWELEDLWELGYEYAKKYFEEFGNLRVPSAFICEDGYRLGTWISNQRSAYNGTITKKLTIEQISKLKDIGMEWKANRRNL